MKKAIAVLDDQNRLVVITGDNLTFDTFVGNGPIIRRVHSHSSQQFHLGSQWCSEPSGIFIIKDECMVPNNFR